MVTLKLTSRRTSRTRKFSSREIIEQLGIILAHPEEYVQEEFLPGQSSLYKLDRYEHGKYEIFLLSSRDIPYLRRWYLSKVLTFGNIGEMERILTTIVFNGSTAMNRLFSLLITKINKRNVELVSATYELCRSLYSNYFPILPNVRDSQTRPLFQVAVSQKRKKKRFLTNRVRNPSAVGGKHRQGLSSLPTFTSGDPGPSNVDEIFLETLNFLESTRSSV